MVFSRRKRSWCHIPGHNGSRAPGPGVAALILFAGVALTSVVFIVRKLQRLSYWFEEVEAEDAGELMEEERDNPDFVILDVRTPSEFEREHLPVAINVSSHSRSFRDELKKFDREKVYLVYSGHGDRGGKASSLMKSLGFRSVYHLGGGLEEWKRSGGQVVG